MTRPAPPGSRSTRLIDVVFDELDDDALDQLAAMLAPRLSGHLTSTAPAADGWLDSTRAAEYLGISRASLHKLTVARALPFEQDGPGCKLWFRRDDLDAWRRGQGVDAAKAQPRSLSTQLRAA